MSPQKYLALASLLTALAVIFGAFGAHALAQRLDPYSLEVWHKANFYHFVHALGLLIVTALVPINMLNANAHRIAAILFVAGIFIFSGSLYLLALTGIKILGAITPIGGLCFIAGWIFLAYKLIEKSPG